MNPHHNSQRQPPRQRGAANYLATGEGSPSLQGQNIAVAHLQRGLNNGLFEHMYHGPGREGFVPRFETWEQLARAFPTGAQSNHTVGSQVGHAMQTSGSQAPTTSAVGRTQAEEHRLTIKASIPAKKGDKYLKKNTEHIVFSVPNNDRDEDEPQPEVPANFLAKIKEMLEVDDGEEFCPVWKHYDEGKRVEFHPLETTAHAQEALKECLPMLRSKRHTKPVFLEVINNVPEVDTEDERSRKSQKPPTATDTGCDKEFGIAKMKLYCHECSNGGINEPGARYCYVQRNGKHKPLDLYTIGLWARLVHDGKADCEFTSPPNALNFDEVTDTSQSSLNHPRNRRNRTDVHFHLDSAFIEEIRNPGTKNQPSETKQKHSPSPDVEEITNIEEENQVALKYNSMTIDKVLTTVHAKFPLFNYPQYRESLVNEGLFYGFCFQDFDESFFQEKIGMVAGAVRPLLHELGVQHERKEEKRARVKRQRREPLTDSRVN
ncbi:hypothetical protein VNI00_017361 [Paramarasmius palmivorus]|uniref:Uncharacterized protein n=1 Tax=Paramarasmius palmivorus TaxID=297713 RepID=A0AAW0B6M6_9AGAR